MNGRDGEEVQRRRFDWALGDLLGGERAPDVTTAVLARRARGEVVDLEPPPARMRPWLAAALLLLGIGAVVSVFVSRRAVPDDGRGQVLQPPQEPQQVRVQREDEIAQLPPDTRAVALIDLGDTAVKKLVQRCPRLEQLLVEAATGFGPVGGVQPLPLTDAAFADIARLPRLRVLRLDGTEQIDGSGLRQLEALPLLEELGLLHLNLDDAALQVLPRLPSLQRLDLTANYGFGADGLSAIAGCPGLRQLDLTHCSQLTLAMFARAQPAVPAAAGRDARRWALPAGLDQLRLAGGLALGPDLGKLLREACPELRELDVSGCPLLDDVTVAHLVGMPHLRRLDLSGCSGISDTCLPLLVAASQLWELKLDELPWLTLAQVEQLFASGKRVAASRKDDAAFTAGVQALAARFAERIQAPYELVTDLARIRRLPADVTRVEVRGLGDAAASALAARGGIVGLRFASAGRRIRLSDAAFAAFARLPQLEELDLFQVDGVHQTGMAKLQALPRLRTLRLRDLNLEDDSLTMLAALMPLPDLPALEQLVLDGTTTFLEQGVEAIAACARLRSLSLRGCGQLQPQWLARLGALPMLEHLDLVGVRSVDDAALAALGGLRQLRSLLLTGNDFTAAGLQALGGMHELRKLLLENRQLPTSALVQLPATLTELQLPDCDGLDAAAAKLLRDRFPGLQRLVVAGDDWVDDAVVATLLQLPRLQSLDLRNCKQVTAAVVPAIAAAAQLRELDLTGCPGITTAAAQQLAAQRPDLAVQRRGW